MQTEKQQLPYLLIRIFIRSQGLYSYSYLIRAYTMVLQMFTES